MHYLQLDGEGRILGVSAEQSEDFPVEFDGELPEVFDNYIYSGGQLTYDVRDLHVAEHVAELKQRLAETDYVCAKGFESILSATTLTGLLSALKSVSTEYGDVLKQRAAWRKEIEDIER